MTARRPGTLLAIDTSTSLAVVALGSPDALPLAEDRWEAGYRHGEELLARIDASLDRAGMRVGDVGAIVVGLGPGAFTGLRVGLATAKGLGLALDRPVVGIPSGLALLDAAGTADGTSAVLLPAGPSDRILVRRSPDTSDALLAVRLPPDEHPEPGLDLLAVDLEGRARRDALERGRAAQLGLGAALLRLGARRLALNGADDLAGLVPMYVTPPRGVEREVEGVVVASS
ncbi:MAG TPA: tRNA (adenosine(37)-N6)-threonylcarbamoyltransferase complex dimerization subunit type 1 TsaB [Candidatus Dormibacteraeota bacterium]|nr:tRNA (adenosine(37)-N6)-threonylcarbamoyltransferase complex dimerization subunit type 1 TsaB [Candidatus Dormibacteraeota bacterium]